MKPVTPLVPSPEELSTIREKALTFARVGVFRYLLDGTIIFMDPGVLRVLDLEDRYPDPAMVVGKDVGTLFQYVQPPGGFREQVHRAGVVRDLEYPLRTLKGHERWVLHNSHLVRDEASGQEAIQVLAADITPLKQAERALRRSEQQFRLITEHSPDGVLLHRDGQVLYANPRLASLLGFSHCAQMVGRPLASVLTLEDDHRLTVGGPPEEVRLISHDGQKRVVEVLSIPLWYEGQDAVLAQIHDLTTQRRAERERQRLQAQVMEGQRLESLGKMAGGIAHDFNNLLTGILGQAELALLELDTHGPCQERVRGIHQAAIRAAELTSQLLDYTGRSPIVIRPIDLSALVGEMNHLLHAAVDRRAEVHLRLAPDLPPVEGDEKQLRQVVLALATNAAETMSTSGRIHISTHLVPAGAPLPGRGRDESTVATGDMVAISVHDEGEGIPPSVFPSIFDPFFSTKATGRGLGLAAADGIMRSHDGQLRVSSQPGGGATFVVLLPAARPPEGGAASADPHRNQSASVLLIDDEEIIIEVTQAILEHSGYQVAATRNGAEAVRLVQSGQISPDVILLDMVMPGEGGRAIRDALVAAGYAGPIVLCSGYASDSASTTFQQQGFAGYLAKPYGAAELLAVVGEMLAS